MFLGLVMALLPGFFITDLPAGFLAKTRKQIA